jgi:type II secretory pathway component PulF
MKFLNLIMSKNLHIIIAWYIWIKQWFIGIWQNVSHSLSAPSLRDQSIFFKRLAMLLEAGVPLSKSLRVCIQDKKIGDQAKFFGLITAIEAGLPLAEALKRSGYPVNSLSQQIIATGEATGTLVENLRYLATLLKDKAVLRKQIQQAFLYPSVILLATVGIALFLVTTILPKIVPVFATAKTALPLSTQILLQVSVVVTDYWYLLISGFLLTIIIIWLLCRYQTTKSYIDYYLLKVPLIGRLIRLHRLALDCRTMSLLLRGQVGVVNALRIIATSTDNSTYKQAWFKTAELVETGQPLAKSLQGYLTLFPTLFVQLVDSGEKTGRLGTTLQYISRMYETDLRDLTKNLTTMLEPVLLLFMGLVVGFIAMSIITPIYGLTSQLHR